MGKIVLEKYTIEVLKELPKDIKIVVLGDIHQDSRTLYDLSYRDKKIKLYKELLEQVARINPDYIAIIGDLIEKENFDNKLLTDLIIELAGIARTVVCQGNHEKKLESKGYSLNWFDELNDFNDVYALENELISFKDITFTTFSPRLESYEPWNFKYRDQYLLEDYRKASFDKEGSKDKIEVLLTHSPYNVLEGKIKDLITNRYDLVLTSHVHNGIVPDSLEKIIKRRGFVAPYNMPLPKYCRGVYELDTTKVLINKGFRKLSKEFNIYNTLDSFYNHHIQEVVLTKKRS